MPRLKPPTSQPAPVERTPVPRLSFSVPEAAESTGLSVSFLYKAMKDGALGFAKAGARRLIPIADLEAFLGRLPKGA